MFKKKKETINTNEIKEKILELDNFNKEYNLTPVLSSTKQKIAYVVENDDFYKKRDKIAELTNILGKEKPSEKSKFFYENNILI